PENLVTTDRTHAVHDRPQGTDREATLGADGTGAGDPRSQLRHLDVMGDLFQPVANDVGDQCVNRVASNIDGSQAHSEQNLQSLRWLRRRRGSKKTLWARWRSPRTLIAERPSTEPSSTSLSPASRFRAGCSVRSGWSSRRR